MQSAEITKKLCAIKIKFISALRREFHIAYPLGGKRISIKDNFTHQENRTCNIYRPRCIARMNELIGGKEGGEKI